MGVKGYRVNCCLTFWNFGKATENGFQLIKTDLSTGGVSVFCLTNKYHSAMIIPISEKNGVGFMLYNGYNLNCVKFAFVLSTC